MNPVRLLLVVALLISMLLIVVGCGSDDQQDLSLYIVEFQKVFAEWHDDSSASSESYPAATDPVAIQNASVQERVESSIKWAEEILEHTRRAKEQWQAIVPPQEGEEAYRGMSNFLNSQEEISNGIISGLSSGRNWTEIELVKFFSEIEPKATEGQRRQWEVLDLHKRLVETSAQ